jgi:SAM-dependent methyltransferase
MVVDGITQLIKGTIEDVPLPAAAVDVVISNCVINLSTDKPRVLAEMFQVLTPGGRIGISDVVAEDHLTPHAGGTRYLRRLHRRRVVEGGLSGRFGRSRVRRRSGDVHARDCAGYVRGDRSCQCTSGQAATRR